MFKPKKMRENGPLCFSDKLKLAELKLRERLFPHALDTIPRYGLAEGIGETRKILAGLRSELREDAVLIVGIAGESGSGKTNFKKRLEREGIRLAGFSLDEYYRDGIQKSDWDRNNGLDFPLLVSHLKQLKRGESIQKPVYSYKGSFRVGFERFDPAPVVVIEGLHALDKRLLKYYDLKIYVDVDRTVARSRVIARDVKERGRRAEDVEKHYRNYVERLADVYVRPTKKNADFIIVNN